MSRIPISNTNTVFAIAMMTNHGDNEDEDDTKDDYDDYNLAGQVELRNDGN